MTERMAVSASDTVWILEDQALQSDVRCQPSVRHPFKSLLLSISAGPGIFLLWQGFKTPPNYSSFSFFFFSFLLVAALTSSSWAQIRFA